MTTLAEIQNSPEGFVPPNLTGNLKALYERKTGGEGDKQWSIQSGVITDGQTDLRIVFSGRDEVAQSLKGQDLFSVARSGERGLYGMKRKDDTYQGNTRNEVWIYGGADVSFSENGQAQEPQPAQQVQEQPVQQEPNHGQESGRTPNWNKVEQPNESVTTPSQFRFPHYGGDASVQYGQDCLMRSVNLMQICLDGAGLLRKANPEMSEAQFQAITSSLFIKLDRSGVADKMPTKALKEEPAEDDVPF